MTDGSEMQLNGKGSLKVLIMGVYYLSNKVEGINDLLVKYGYLEDDNCTIIKKMILSYKGIDRDDPR